MGVWWEPVYIGNNKPQQEMNAMSVKAGDTLDGMTVEQLRDLAKRAEAAAKKQEDEAKKKEEAVYVALGNIDSWEWRIRKSDGQVSYQSKYSDLWRSDSYSEELAPIIRMSSYGALGHMVEILKRVAEKKRAGAFQ